MRRYRKHLWIERRQKFKWILSVVILALFIVAVFMIVSTLNNPTAEGNSIGFFNLLVDLVVGGFALWQLHLLVTDSAKTPDLVLKTGKKENGQSWPFADSKGELICEDIEATGPSPKKGKGVWLPLWLENKEPTRAGTCVRVEVRIYSKTLPDFYDFKVIGGLEKPYEFQFKDTKFYSVILQFKDDLIVYHDSAHYLGMLGIGWCNSLPSDLKIEYKIHSLEGRLVSDILGPYKINLE